MTQRRIQEALQRTFVAIGLAALLVGCGGGNSDSATVDAPPPPDEPITVRAVMPETVAILAGGGRAVMNELLVVTDATLTVDGAVAVFAQHGLTVVGRVPEANFFQLTLPAVATEAELSKKRDELSASVGILSVSLNRISEVQSLVVPNDPKYSEQSWGFDLIEAPSAWGLLSDRQKDHGLSSVKVGVIDTGFVGASDQLAFGKLYGPTGVEGADAAAPPAIEVGPSYQSKEYIHAWMQHNHGMHVAGIIAAKGNDSLNTVGVAWQSPIKLYAARNDSNASVVAHLARLVRDDVRVINFSFGWLEASGDEQSKLEFNKTFALVSHSLLKRKDFLMVFAAGNEGVDATRQTYLGHVFTSNSTCLGLEPEQCLLVKSHVLIVGAVGSEYDYWKLSPKLAGYSNFGVAVEIAAPGGDGDPPSGAATCAFEQVDPFIYTQNITSAQLSAYKSESQSCIVGFGVASLGADGGRILMTGTSQAAPFVSGAAALLLSVNPKLSASQLKSLLISTARVRASSTYGDIPVVNLHDALKEAALTTGIGFEPANTTTSVFVFSLSCQYTKNSQGTIDPGMEGVSGVPVNITRFSVEANAYVPVVGGAPLVTDGSGLVVAFLSRGVYKLSIDKTDKNQAYSIPGSFLIDPPGADAAKTYGLILRGDSIKGCADDLLPSTAPFSIDIAYASTLDTILSQGGWGNIEQDLSGFVTVSVIGGGNGIWQDETWDMVHDTLPRRVNDRPSWVLSDSGWTRDDSGTYVAQADGSVRIFGGSFGLSGAIGSVRTQDLSGQLMLVAGLSGPAANEVFPIGTQANWWKIVTSETAYRLVDYALTNSRANNLVDFVAIHQTPQVGQTQVISWPEDNTYSYTFDGPLANQGVVSFWGQGTLLGKGGYELRVVKGQQVLVIADVPTAALDYATSIGGNGVVDAYRKGSRRIFGVASGGLYPLYRGFMTPAGTSVDTRPGLNRVGLNAALMALRVCTLPDINGTSICPQWVAVPQTPQGAAPGNSTANGALLGIGATLHWEASFGADAYSVVLTDLSTGLKIGVQRGSSQLTLDLDSSLQIGGLPFLLSGHTYEWSVVACSQSCSPPTPALKFRLGV